MKMMKLMELMTLLAMTALGDAVAISVFLTPYNYNSGGASGIVMILQHLVNIQMGYGMMGLNLILLFVALFVMNRKYVVFTAMAAVIQAFEYVLLEHVHYALPSNLSLLAAVVGGIIEGLSVAISFKHKFSFGGMDLICKLVQRISGRNIGTLNLYLKGLVLLVSFVFSPSVVLLCGSIAFLVSTSVAANSIVLGKTYWTSWSEKLKGILILLQWNAKEPEPTLYEASQEYQDEDLTYSPSSTVTSQR